MKLPLAAVLGLIFCLLGAVVGTGFGFGLGHPFQSRYVEKGWYFTAAQIGGLVLAVYGGLMGDCALHDQACKDRQDRRAPFAAAGILLYVG